MLFGRTLRLLTSLSVFVAPTASSIVRNIHMASLDSCATPVGRVLSREPLTLPFRTLDPFMFCMHHKDHYPAGVNMALPNGETGNGADFDWNKPYRHYHSENGIPGFPRHPHRGFETWTATMQGLIDHADSAGNSGRYGNGDLQVMTAGSGIQHSEMFPLLNSDKPNTAELMQVWLNLPRKSKMVKPGFTMHWSEEVPLLRGETGARITLWAGELFGATALPPPPESYASDPRSDLLILNIRLPPGASCVLPAARSGSAAHRAVYFYEGPALEIAGENVPSRRMLVVDAAAPVSLRNTAAPGGVECGAFVLQGVPIGEPVVQRGPFVMNSAQEIQQAYMDYQRTQFGKWTFADDGPVFGATKGRFANQDGVETTPPAAKQ